MCARYLSDQNKVVLLLDSGTYGVQLATGQWPGLVESHTISEKQNIIETRFLGQASRNVGIFNPGALDFTGTMSLLPQDWRLLGFALGSISTTSGTAQTNNYAFSMSEVNTGARSNAFTSGTFNPWISFAVEESRTGPTASQNSMRTLKGCVVNTYTIDVTQGAPIKVDVGFIAQSGSWFSGTTTAVTAGSNRPFLWSDTVFQIAPDQIGTAAVTQEPVKRFTFKLNNNFVGPHYLNGSRVISVPYPLNRDYEVTVMQDLESTTVGSLYNALYQGGSLFNAVFDVNNTQDTGSHHLILTFSGCKMKTMELPAQLSAINETTYTFTAGSVSAISHDRLPLYTAF